MSDAVGKDVPTQQRHVHADALLRVHRLCRVQRAGRVAGGRIGKKKLLLLGLGLNAVAC